MHLSNVSFWKVLVENKVYPERILFNKNIGKSIKGLSHDAMELFMDYTWPGNVRELKNAMEIAFVTTEGSSIQLEHLPKKITSPKKQIIKIFRISY